VVGRWDGEAIGETRVLTWGPGEKRVPGEEGTGTGLPSNPYYLVNHDNRKNEGPFGKKNCTLAEIEK